MGMVTKDTRANGLKLREMGPPPNPVGVTVAIPLMGATGLTVATDDGPVRFRAGAGMVSSGADGGSR